MTNDQWIATLLAELITFARAEYGEPEYTYHRAHYVWQSGKHHMSAYDPTNSSREEYDANVAQGERDRSEAFMGRLRRDYYTYRRRLKTEGWPQRLVAMIEEAAETDEQQKNLHR